MFHIPPLVHLMCLFSRLYSLLPDIRLYPLLCPSLFDFVHFLLSLPSRGTNDVPELVALVEQGSLNTYVLTPRYHVDIQHERFSIPTGQANSIEPR